MGQPLSVLDIGRLGTYAGAGDCIAYYAQLVAWGYDYGALAMGIKDDGTLSGETDSIFFRNEDITISAEQLARISIQLMQADFAARKRFAIDNPGQELTYDVVQQYHADVLKSFHVSVDTWTPNIALDELQTPEEKQALWTHLLTSSAVDLCLFVLQSLLAEGDPAEQFATAAMIR